jgi:hypothetical protein
MRQVGSGDASRVRSRAEQKCVATAILAWGLLVCHDTKVDGMEVRLGSTAIALIPDIGLACSSERLQRTVTRNRHFGEQADSRYSGGYVLTLGRRGEAFSGSRRPRFGEYADAPGWVLTVHQRFRKPIAERTPRRPIGAPESGLRLVADAQRSASAVEGAVRGSRCRRTIKTRRPACGAGGRIQSRVAALGGQ